MLKYKKLLWIAGAIFLFLFITSCIPGTGHFTPGRPANFLTGIWHGWIAPVSLIGGLFNPSIRIYEPINTGWWYDFGFYISIIAGFGGIQLIRKKKD